MSHSTYPKAERNGEELLKGTCLYRRVMMLSNEGSKEDEEETSHINEFLDFRDCNTYCIKEYNK